MGLFGFKKKEKPVDTRTLSSVDEKGIATIKCPHCYAVLFTGYYRTLKTEPLTECPYCHKEIKVL